MPEPITILSSALCVATNAVTLGKQTYDIINSIRNAPDYITDLAADLHGLYVVLGTLQSALHVEDRKGAQSRFSVEAVENLKDFLENCMKCLNKTSKVVQPHLKANGGVVRSAWKGFKWDTFKKSDIVILRGQLAHWKLNLSVLCSVYTLLNQYVHSSSCFRFKH